MRCLTKSGNYIPNPSPPSTSPVGGFAYPAIGPHLASLLLIGCLFLPPTPPSVDWALRPLRIGHLVLIVASPHIATPGLGSRHVGIFVLPGDDGAGGLVPSYDRPAIKGKPGSRGPAWP